MITFILAILALLAGIAATVIFKKKIITIIAGVLALILLAFSTTSIVPTGFTGVLTTFGRVEENTLDAGLNFKAPWQNVITMDNREQRLSFTFEAFSSDIQQTSVTGSVNFNINKQTAMTLYQEIGQNYSNILIAPRLYENTKVVFSRYTAENLISSRDNLASEILELMRQDLEQYGINIISISIEDIDFTDAFTDAIEAKQVATQNKLRTETEQEEAIIIAESAAEQRTIAAEAEAEVARIEADAEAYRTQVSSEAEAKANELIAASLSAELIEYLEVQGWNGQLPDTFVGSDEAIPVLPIQ